MFRKLSNPEYEIVKFVFKKKSEEYDIILIM